MALETVPARAARSFHDPRAARSALVKEKRDEHALETSGVRLSRTRRFRRCTGRL